MRQILPLSLILAGLAAISACAPSDIGVIDIEHPVVERNKETIGSDEKIDEAQKELDDVMQKVRKGDLPKIQFELDSADITLVSYATLDAIAQLLASHPRLKLLILAHTCNLGTPAYNMDLSKRRAKSVKTYLVIKGIPPPSIRYIGKGLTEPIADNKTDEGRALNRRVEFRITYRDWSSVY